MSCKCLFLYKSIGFMPKHNLGTHYSSLWHRSDYSKNTWDINFTSSCFESYWWHLLPFLFTVTDGGGLGGGAAPGLAVPEAEAELSLHSLQHRAVSNPPNNLWSQLNRLALVPVPNRPEIQPLDVESDVKVIISHTRPKKDWAIKQPLDPMQKQIHRLFERLWHCYKGSRQKNPDILRSGWP